MQLADFPYFFPELYAGFQKLTIQGRRGKRESNSMRERDASSFSSSFSSFPWWLVVHRSTDQLSH